MTAGHDHKGASSEGDALVARAIDSVVIVDDARDTFAENEPTTNEIEDLWSKVEFDIGALDEIAALGVPRPIRMEHLIGSLIDRLRQNSDQCPNFDRIWTSSYLGVVHAAAIKQIDDLAALMSQRVGTEPQVLGSDCEPDEIAKQRPQLVFMDWRLGRSGQEQAVQAAVEKATQILSSCASIGVDKPLIVLISSNVLSDEASSDFCRRSRIIKGMFYAVNKGILTNPVHFPTYMHLFESSLTTGRKLQSLMDSLHSNFAKLSTEFLDHISELTLADYAFVQSLSLRDDSQPLGDYLLWLFSTYLGQLLLTEPLKNVRADLDATAWYGTVPSLEPPSERLNELYRNALYDISVERVISHPLAGQGDIPVSIVGPLGLGDIFQREKSADSDAEDGLLCLDPWCTANSLPDPDVMLLISPQCDLECRPENFDRNVVLIGGTFIPFQDRAIHRDATITDLFVHQDIYCSIVWNLKSAETVVYREFGSWLSQRGFQREGRLRLPFALEVQRAFAADFIRIGTRIAPPIYQPLEMDLERANRQLNEYEHVERFDNGKGAFLMLTKSGQQCVLTTQLLNGLRSILSKELTDMYERGGQSDAPHYLPKQIIALENVLKDQSKWSELQSPFPAPQVNSPKNVIDGWVQVVRGDAGVTPSGHKPVAVVRIEQNDADTT